MRVNIIPLVVGSLGAIRKQFGNRLREIGITAEIVQVQKIVLLGTARILRKVLSKSKIAGCGLILRDFSSIVSCVLPQ